MHPAGHEVSEAQRLTGLMPAAEPAPAGDGTASRCVDRRTLLVGVAGALAAAGLSGPARAAGRVTPARPGPARALTRPWRVGLRRCCAPRCAIPECTPREGSCAESRARFPLGG
jgi:hypothetical protein